NGQRHPLVAPAVRRVRVGGTDGVAVAAFAVDFLAAVFGHRVVAGQGYRPGGHPAPQDAPGQGTAETPRRPATFGKDTVITRRMTGCQVVHRAQQVEDGAAAGGQDGRQQQHHEAFGGRPSEGSGQSLHEIAGNTKDATRQRSRPMRPPALGLPSSPALSFLLPSPLRIPLPSRLGYSAHWSLRALESWV